MNNIDNKHNLKNLNYTNILDQMVDPVRVVDINHNVLFINDTMKKYFGNDDLNKACYSYFNLDSACENCISSKAISNGHICEKEIILGNKNYHVISSPIIDSNNKSLAAIEVFRDITKLKNLQNSLHKTNKILEKELEMAKTVQRCLLPKDYSSNDINFYYKYFPCHVLGGDFLNWFKIDETHYGVYIADVSGHGVLASMLTVFLDSIFNKESLNPADCLKDIFYKFNLNYSESSYYITVFYLIIDLKNNEIKYCNAGHNATPLLIGDNNQIEFLRKPGIPISNWVENPDYENSLIRFKNGDRLFLYTDGIIELKNDSGEQFGENNILSNIIDKNKSLSEIINIIITEATNFTKSDLNNNLQDDITMALLELKSNNQ